MVFSLEINMLLRNSINQYWISIYSTLQICLFSLALKEGILLQKVLLQKGMEISVVDL